MSNGHLGAQHTKLEILLAFAFGFIFCGILAYAGLRSEPITDPGQFFLLRVLAAVSAAGVAAVIPGMLNIQIGHGKLFAIRGAGALAVFALVYQVNPPDLIRPLSESKRSAMEGSYAQGLYRDASRIADEILKSNAQDAQSLNIKGGVAFYEGNFPLAVEYFSRAHDSVPKDSLVTSNMANALIETGAYQRAIELFKTIDDGKLDRSFSLGRAYLYAGELSEAQKRLEGVPTEYWHGAARILEAAALASMGENAQTETARTDFERRSTQKFHEGYAVDKDYWDRIVDGKKDIHLSYDVPIRLLKVQIKNNAAASARLP